MPRVPHPAVSASAEALTNLVQLFPAPPAAPASPPSDHVALLTEWMSLGASMAPRQLAVVLSGARQAAARSVRV